MTIAWDSPHCHVLLAKPRSFFEHTPENGPGAHVCDFCDPWASAQLLNEEGVNHILQLGAASSVPAQRSMGGLLRFEPRPDGGSLSGEFAGRTGR